MQNIKLSIPSVTEKGNSPKITIEKLRGRVEVKPGSKGPGIIKNGLKIKYLNTNRSVILFSLILIKFLNFLLI